MCVAVLRLVGREVGTGLVILLPTVGTRLEVEAVLPHAMMIHGHPTLDQDRLSFHLRQGRRKIRDVVEERWVNILPFDYYCKVHVLA